jgi:hypothetical protein
MDNRCGKNGEYYPGVHNEGHRLGPWWLSYKIDHLAARCLRNVPVIGLPIFRLVHRTLYRYRYRECRHGQLVT